MIESHCAVRTAVMMIRCAELTGLTDHWQEWPADAVAVAVRIEAGPAGPAEAGSQGIPAGRVGAPGGRPAEVDRPGRLAVVVAVAADKPGTAAVRVAVEPAVEWLPRLGFEQSHVRVALEHCYCCGFAAAEARSAAAIRPVELLPARHWQQSLRPFQEPLACFAWYQYSFGRHLLN